MAEVTGNYISESDVLNWPEDISDTDKQTTIDMVEQLIELITHDYFYAADFDVTVDGNGKDRLYLGLIPDILSITSITVAETVLATSSYTFDKNFVMIDSGVTFDIELDIIRGDGGMFPRGYNNINVVGTYGWTACPEAIKRAAIILARHENNPDEYTTYMSGGERIGPYSYQTTERPLTGVLEADRLLKLYIRKKPRVGVV